MSTSTHEMSDRAREESPDSRRRLRVFAWTGLVLLSLLCAGTGWLAALIYRHWAAAAPDIALASTPWRIRAAPDRSNLICLCLLRNENSLSGAVTRVDASRNTPPRELARFDAIVRDTAWSPDELHFALCTDDGRIEVWDAASNQRIWARRIGDSPVHSVAFSMREVVAVSGTGAEPGCGGRVLFLESQTGDSRDNKLLHDTPVCLVIDRGTDRAFVGNRYGGLISVYDMTTHDRLEQFGWRTGVTGDPRDPGIADLALSSDGRILAAAGDDGLTIWDVQSHHQMHELNMLGATFFDVEFPPNGNSFVATFGLKRKGDDEFHIGRWQITENVLQQVADLTTASVVFSLAADDSVYLAVKNGLRRVPLPGHKRR